MATYKLFCKERDIEGHSDRVLELMQTGNLRDLLWVAKTVQMHGPRRVLWVWVERHDADGFSEIWREEGPGYAGKK